MFINVGSYIDATKKGDFEYYALLERHINIETVWNRSRNQKSVVCGKSVIAGINT
jgi:hypothetical protein